MLKAVSYVVGIPTHELRERVATAAPPAPRAPPVPPPVFEDVPFCALAGSIERADLPNFVRFVFKAMNSPGVTPEQVVARSTELTQRLVKQLPQDAAHFSLGDVLRATERIIEYLKPTAEELSDERGQLGSKQLRKMRRQLAENRLTMPLFDTRGWVRDFEKALKIQWEIYANGFSPMHIVVARSDRLYGIERWDGVKD